MCSSATHPHPPQNNPSTTPYNSGPAHLSGQDADASSSNGGSGKGKKRRRQESEAETAQHVAPPPPAMPTQHKRIPPEVLRHFSRRADILPQGAWPLHPRAGTAAPPPLAPAQRPPLKVMVRRPPPDAAPEWGAEPVEVRACDCGGRRKRGNHLVCESLRSLALFSNTLLGRSPPRAARWPTD